MDALDLADEHDVVAMTEDARIGMKKPHRTMFMKNWRCSLTRCLRDLSARTAAAAEETYFGSLQLSWNQFNVTSVFEQAAEVASSAAAAASEAAANITSVVAEGASVAAAAASDATTSAYVGASAAVAAASEATASVYDINVTFLLAQAPEASAEPKVFICQI